MKKTIIFLVVVSATYAVSTRSMYAQENWDYSYTFSDGLVVSGSFEGTQVGNDINGYVDNISDLKVFFNGTPMTGTVYAASWTGELNSDGWWIYTSDPVVSFDMAQNNFMFINSDVVDGDNSGNQFFWSPPESLVGAPTAWALDLPLGINSVDFDFPANASSWSLVDPVPDGGSTVMLCGMSLAALGLSRRKLA